MTKDTRTFKVLLVGNSGVGKTAFLHRYLKKRFEHSLPVTANVEKHDILLHATVGPVRYEIWDVSGTQKPNTLASREFDEIDAAIIMFDLTDRISYNNVPNWYQSLVNKDGMRLGRYIPICICGNKNDASVDAKLPPKAITFPKKKGTGYVEMSVMDLENIHGPFIDLARQLKNPVVWYKPMPDVGPAVVEFRNGRDRRWPRENSSQYPKHEFGPRVQTKEIPPIESPPAPTAEISAEKAPTVIESPKKADAPNGQLKFISTTNKAQNWIKPSGNGTISVFGETKSAVNETVLVAEAEQTKLHIVPTEEPEVTKHHEPAREHHEPRKEHRESKKTLASPEQQPTPPKNQTLFVMCIHCIRMVLIKCIEGTPLAQLSNDNPSFALITTACRSCCHDSKKSQSDEVRMSPDLIRYTAMYECARKVAEDEVEVLTNKKSVAHISLDKLTSSIGRECQIQGISTSSDTLQRLRQLARKDVLLGYVPGAFL
ncbi:putative RAN small monomeric GTPase (Ran) [Aspergillus novofumigatus IBT 16806]|uniref:Putative RAN small monomeric GTPase n=1 Tax=Aspergillus novofumigatus (strain IBT 16806) TaxID=1392255 RepID=A0A2I1CFI2_ASPN1|nr:putative RAN small monomeric GTPase [Aspergillus novofumigatus IBT 16806]PKX96382.1 putative RAN small monomeric GTPase [Aspergillus novofumigatus IBT 16806]